MNYYEQLEEQGYFVIEKMLAEELCAALLGYVVGECGKTQTNFILESNFRIHTPLALTPLVQTAISQIVTPTYSITNEFLKGEQRLVELSSITVFPHAKAQNLHPDEQNEGKFLLTVFVNLAPVIDESGALRVIPGSHRTPNENYSEATPEILELPTGSAVFMNSKTWHCGGANQTQDRIRPVFYVSFGEPDLEGPTYSIRPDVYQQSKVLADFKGPNSPTSITWTAASIPTLPEKTLIVAPINFNQNPTLLLMVDGVVTRQVKLSPEMPWVQDTIALVVHESGKYTLDDIHKKVDVDVDWLIQFFTYYGQEGWFTCR